MINGLILKDLTTIGLTNNPDTLKLHEPIYIDSKLYLLVGLKFNAIQGQYMVTLQELNYDFLAGVAQFTFILMEALSESWIGAPASYL